MPRRTATAAHPAAPAARPAGARGTAPDPAPGPHRRRLLVSGAAALAAWPWLATGQAVAAPTASTAPTARTDEAPGARHTPWPPKRPTPPLDLPQLDGPAWRLADARGQLVVLNFWASWCEPCRAELPSLELLSARLAPERGTVVTVNFKEGEGTVRRFVQQQGLTLPVLRDADGAAAKAWGVRVFPTTVLVARSGRAVASVVGELDWTGPQARQWLAALT